MPIAPKMVIVALVLSLLALPAFGVRGEGLERILSSSQPLNSLDHVPAGLIEVEAGTGGRETENEDRKSIKLDDECDRELRSLEENFTKTCERHDPGATQVGCRTQAKSTIEHKRLYQWQDRLARKVLNARKTPVFWAGFWPGGEEGIDTRQALADFISSVNGFQLANTEWGQAAESEGVNNLENCTWDRKENWWNAASIKLAEAMADRKVPNIIIALHKTLHGEYSFYKSILYQAELVQMGYKIKLKKGWYPKFEVRSIAVKGAPPDESGCALASEVKSRLELGARRSVTVWCRLCTTLRRCGPKQRVEKKTMEGKCIEGNCRNGQGTATSADAKYHGGWKNGLRDGQGTATYADGNIYQGGFKNDKMDGQGTATYADGNIYQGGFKNDKKDGQGTFTFAHGDVYQGGFKDDKMDGQGTFTLASGDKYHGGWKNGLLDGQGTYTYANGNIYQGGFRKGLWDGQGTATYADGNIYQGGFRNGLWDGRGTLTYADGNIYQGFFKKDLPDGQGTMTLADGDKYKVWFKEGHLTKRVKKKKYR